jgi:UDP-N-acetylmuramate--alanine ligase
MALRNAKHIHLIGIGGIGLSAIARILLARGYRVSGSDPAPSRLTDELVSAGAPIFSQHRAENLGDTDLVIVTSAASATNPELRAAEERGIPVVKRREFLKELTAGYRTIAVAGSHGKTTTTALIGLMLADAGLDPTMIVGGIVPELESNARAGQGEYFAIEADEYDYAFSGLEPYIAVVTNVDYDHPDLFPTREKYQGAFAEFMRAVRGDGTLFVCGDDAGAIATVALASPTARVLKYGREDENDWRAVDVRTNEMGGSDFTILKMGHVVGRVQTRIPGAHNVLNTLAAVGVADHAGVSVDDARMTLAKFRGVGRRFELCGEFGGVTIVDDYAHHPTEIRATLAAARASYPHHELWAVFQPHTFTRTRALLDDFANAFDSADHVIVTEVYAAREHDSLGVSGHDIVKRMKHRDAHFIPTLDETVDYLLNELKPSAVLVTLGAGNVNEVGQRIAAGRDA